MGMKRRFRVEKFLKEDSGSVSLIVMALFMLTIITAAILTDISSIYFAKRALTQATEAAAQRAVRNLDLDAYYRGEYNAASSLASIAGLGFSDPGIPIDCAKGEMDARNALSDWSAGGKSISRSNLGEINLEELSCDGYSFTLSTASTATLPFILPFIDISRVRITSTVGSVDQRKSTSNYYGVDIGVTYE
jgi:Flp pilus assembly protein TadG